MPTTTEQDGSPDPGHGRRLSALAAALTLRFDLPQGEAGPASTGHPAELV